MKHGRSRHLIRTVILLVVAALTFIIASAAIRYNRSAGLFDSHEHHPQKKDTRVSRSKRQAKWLDGKPAFG